MTSRANEKSVLVVPFHLKPGTRQSEQIHGGLSLDSGNRQERSRDLQGFTLCGYHLIGIVEDYGHLKQQDFHPFSN